MKHRGMAAMIRDSLLAATATLLLAMPASAQAWAEKTFETTSHERAKSGT